MVPIRNSDFGPTDTRLMQAEAPGDTLGLPFFDDFSTAKGNHPETRYWAAGSGVYINNTLTTNHPSINVATFDGVNSKGGLYSANPLSQNFTDTLTSKPINLAGKASKDAIFLSFYWAGKGLGEKPDSSDYMSLEFYGRDKVWSEVWRQTGFNIDNSFHQVLLAITDANYLHNGFQFRFRGYGRNSGPYDTWHLDYVYVNEKRSPADRFIRDITTRKPLTPFLKNYTAMPLRQYRLSPALATSDSMRTDVLNRDNAPDGNSNGFIFTLKANGKLDTLFADKGVRIQPLEVQPRSFKVTPFIAPAALTGITLTYQMKVITTDSLNPGLKIDLTRNDTIDSYTELRDYYAYDDGSAEYGVQVNQKLGRVAVRYVLSKPDTIAGVRLSLATFNRDITGQSFTIQLYGSKSGRPGNVLTERAISAKFPDERNGFLEYAFISPVAVADTFYIGWTQINEEPVTFGFDRNSLLGKDKLYYNLGTSWSAETGLSGSVMIRPYLGSTGKGVVTGDETPSVRSSYFSPNPSKGIITWQNDQLRQIDIHSMQGALIQSIPVKGVQSVSLSVPADGMYIIRAWDGKRYFSQKMLIIK